MVGPAPNVFGKGGPAVPFAVFNESAVANYVISMVNANGTSIVSFVPGSSRTGLRIDEIQVTNNDTINHVVRLHFAVGGLYYLLGSYTVVAGQGTAGAPGIDMLAQILGDSDGLVLGPAEGLGVSQEVAITGATTVVMVARGGFV